MFHLGKMLIFLGVVLIAAGTAVMVAPRIPFLGKLPGDIHIKKDHYEISIPLATGLLLSAAASGLFWLIRFIGKK